MHIRAVSAVKSARTWASSRIEVPTSTTLHASTTCICFPSWEAWTLEISLKSICQRKGGAGPLIGLRLRFAVFSNALMPFQNTVDRAGARNREIEEAKGRIA